MTIEQLTTEAITHRERAKEAYRENRIAEGLEHSYQATRRETYIELLKGNREILKACIELNKEAKPKQSKEVTREKRQRTYKLRATTSEYTQGARRAWENIHARQSEARVEKLKFK